MKLKIRVSKKSGKDARRRAIRLKLNKLSTSDAYSYFCRKFPIMPQVDFALLLIKYKTFYDLVIAFKRVREKSLSVTATPRPERDHIITSGGGVHNIDENVKWNIGQGSNLASVDCQVVNRIGPSGSIAAGENLILELRSAGCKLVIHPLADNCVLVELRSRSRR